MPDQISRRSVAGSCRISYCCSRVADHLPLLQIMVCLSVFEVMSEDNVVHGYYIRDTHILREWHSPMRYLYATHPTAMSNTRHHCMHVPIRRFHPLDILID